MMTRSAVVISGAHVCRLRCTLLLGVLSILYYDVAAGDLRLLRALNPPPTRYYRPKQDCRPARKGLLALVPERAQLQRASRALVLQVRARGAHARIPHRSAAHLARTERVADASLPPPDKRTCVDITYVDSQHEKVERGYIEKPKTICMDQRMAQSTMI
eukprot:3532436-Pleurochrysis_carterae.AAC.1